MSARLFKSGTQVGVAFAPFKIPNKSESLIEEVHDDVATPAPEITALRESHEDVERHVRWLLDTAQSEADALMAQTQARVAQIESEAYEKGLAEARARVNEEMSSAVADLREKLTHTLSELESLYTLIATRAERDLVKLALEIARKVVHREVNSDPDIVLTMARVALERLHPRAIAKVLLHPEDFEYVKANRHKLSNTSALELIADGSVDRGGCIIQSEHGDIDARIEQQFAGIERGFFQ